MNTKKIFSYIISLGILSGSLIFSALVANMAASADESDIKYPIAELGSCKDKERCKTYCDKPENTLSCIAFAEKNNLMTEDEIEHAKKFIEAGAKGPGGCKGKNECETYCDDISHIDECVAFAEKSGILSGEELEEAKQVQSAIKRGVKPPACKNKK